MDEIYSRFRNFVRENKMILPGEKILLSLSAGKDSMFMLHLIKKLQNEINFAAGVFHLNHMTRGEETDKDEIFVSTRCEEYAIPFYMERYDFEKNRPSDISFEEHARNIRYSLLKKISETEGYSKIATAHNINDNSETVLMRILSGTGIAGLKGILPVTDRIIRPILFADKKEIYAYLKMNNIEWREDLSNSENKYLRNYIRNAIFPGITERFPDADENIFNLSNHAIENQLLVAGLADSLYPDAVTRDENEIIIDVHRFHLNFPLIKFFISRVLYENYGLKMKISIHNEIIRRYMINSSNMVLYEKENLVIRKRFNNNRTVIAITDNNQFNADSTDWEYNVLINENTVIRLIEIKKELKVMHVNYDFYMMNRNHINIIFIQPEGDFESVLIRNRRPGDRIRIEYGTKKIKDLMIEKKLDSKIKNCIPLIEADNQIAAYLPGLVNSNNNRVACNFRIRNDTKRILAFFFSDY